MLRQVSMWALGCAVGILTTAQASDRGFVMSVGVAASSAEGTARAEDVAQDLGAGFRVDIDGLPFEGREESLFASVGYRLNAYVGLELEYRDFGEFQGPEFTDFFGEPIGQPVLGAEAWSANVRMRYPLPRAFDAQWHAGVSRFQYDVTGSVETGFPFFEEIFFATPKDRTGYHWGFGFGWNFAPHWSANLQYRQHRSRVMDFETAGLELAWSF